MAFRAEAVSRQDRPAMEPESSIKKMVSKIERKAYESSTVVLTLPVIGVVGEAGV